MEKKRSIGVIMVGIFVIAWGLMRITALLFLFRISSFDFQMLQKTTGVGLSQTVASIIIIIGLLLSGVAILFLKNWARKLLIGLLALEFCSSLINFCFINSEKNAGT